MNPGSEAAHARATILAAMHGPTAGEIIRSLADGSQALLGLIEKLSQTRDPNLADQIAAQADGIRRTAHRARISLQVQGADHE